MCVCLCMHVCVCVTPKCMVIVLNTLAILYFGNLLFFRITNSFIKNSKVKKKKEFKSGRLVSRKYLSLSIHIIHMMSLDKKMATHSNLLAWEIPWIEEPGKL